MNILFFPISGRKGASSRYRVYQYQPYLEQAGYGIRMLQPAERKGRGIGRFLSGVLEEYNCLKAAREHDIVFIQKRLFSRGFLKGLGRLGKKVVFDFDDSIFTSPKGDWAGPTRRKVLGRIKMTFGISDLVIAGNEFLKEYASDAGAKRGVVIPTALDAGKYSVKEHRQSRTPVIGWIGSSVNHAYLDMLSGVLPRLAGEFPGLRLLVVSDKDYKVHGITVENRRWSEEAESRDLSDMDIGVMPLADNGWTRGKCAFKAIQYMAASLPVVCSAVGANKEVVADGVEGYLPEDEDGWLAALRELIVSPEKRAAMGMAGRGKVVDRYDIRKASEALTSCLGGLYHG